MSNSYSAVFVGIYFVHQLLNLSISQCQLLAVETLLELFNGYRAARVLVVVVERSLEVVLLQVCLACKATGDELSVVNEAVFVRIHDSHQLVNIICCHLAARDFRYTLL